MEAAWPGTVVTAWMLVLDREGFAVRRLKGRVDRLDERDRKSRTHGVTRQGGCRTASAQHGSRRASVSEEEDEERGRIASKKN